MASEDKPPGPGFTLDDGSLDNVTPRECFMLGMNFEEFLEKALRRGPFKHVIRAGNYNRIIAYAKWWGCQFTIKDFDFGTHLIHVTDYSPSSGSSVVGRSGEQPTKCQGLVRSQSGQRKNESP